MDMALPARAFDPEYADALERFLNDPSEAALRAAYELGRKALARQLSVLDIAASHHECLAEALASRPERARETTLAARDFLLETLSAFEMVQRGFRETRETAATERRQAVLLRRLSTFLADASLAATAPEARHELLQLAAEQACELVDAEFCVAVATFGDPRTVAFVTSGGDAPREVPDWVAEIVDGWPARATGEQLAQEAAVQSAAVVTKSAGPRNAVSAQLVALDGRELGFIQLFNRNGGEFTDVDEAVLVHVAQMTSAALERARLYAARP
jgi:Phosphoserine phosphatase RsbU, N-terminal domain/GAF domain